MCGLTFDPVGHKYTLDGRTLANVTALVAPLGDDLDDGMDDIVERAADRGTTMHAYIAQRLEGAPEAECRDELPAAYQAYADGVEMFLAEHTIMPMAVEAPICDAARGIAGTPDLLCEMGGVLAVLDYKFVSQVAKTRVKAQLNGYRQLLEAGGVYPQTLWAVQFMAGDYRLYPVAVDDTEFDLCVRLWELKNKKHPRGRIA